MAHKAAAHGTNRRWTVQTLARTHYRASRALLGRLAHRCSAEDVHKARVAVRRLRTILSALAPAIAASASSRLQRDLKDIADQLGAVRDADIRCGILLPMLRDMDGSSVVAAHEVMAALQSMRRKARQRLQEQLHSGSSRERRRALARLIDDCSIFEPGARADELLASTLRRQWKKMVRAVGQNPDTPGRLHALRIRVKKCRYLLDAGGTRVGRSRDMKASTLLHDLQNCLGDLHDFEQIRRWLKQQPLQPALSKPLKAGLRKEAARKRARLEPYFHSFPKSGDDCSMRTCTRICTSRSKKRRSRINGTMS